MRSVTTTLYLGSILLATALSQDPDREYDSASTGLANVARSESVSECTQRAWNRAIIEASCSNINAALEAKCMCTSLNHYQTFYNNLFICFNLEGDFTGLNADMECIDNSRNRDGIVLSAEEAGHLTRSKRFGNLNSDLDTVTPAKCSPHLIARKIAAVQNILTIRYATFCIPHDNPRSELDVISIRASADREPGGITSLPLDFNTCATVFTAATSPISSLTTQLTDTRTPDPTLQPDQAGLLTSIGHGLFPRNIPSSSASTTQPATPAPRVPKENPDGHISFPATFGVCGAPGGSCNFNEVISSMNGTLVTTAVSTNVTGSATIKTSLNLTARDLSASASTLVEMLSGSMVLTTVDFTTAAAYVAEESGAITIGRNSNPMIRETKPLLPNPTAMAMQVTVSTLLPVRASLTTMTTSYTSPYAACVSDNDRAVECPIPATLPALRKMVGRASAAVEGV